MSLATGRGLAFSVALLLAIGSGAEAQSPKVEAGTLVCQVEGGVGFVFGSTKRLDCLFKSGGIDDHYTGTVMKFGIDIGATTTSTIVWTVFGPTASTARGSLAGTFSGVTSEATVGLGVGANALVGVDNKLFVLQPVSGQVQQGLNVAAGIATINLHAK